MRSHTERLGVIDATYTVAKGVILWLMLFNPAISAMIVAGGATIGFAAEYALVGQRTAKDEEQDQRMNYMDERDRTEQTDRAVRRVESQAWNTRQDEEIKDLSDTVHTVIGWGSGAFGALTILQVIGLLRKNKGE